MIFIISNKMYLFYIKLIKLILVIYKLWNRGFKNVFFYYYELFNIVNLKCELMKFYFYYAINQHKISGLNNKII